LFNNVKVARFHKDFDLALPRCIVLDGTHSDADLEACTAPGLLRHVAGYRGIRAHLEEASLAAINGIEGVVVTGNMTLSQLGPDMQEVR
jgi:hypothetical protein